MHICTSPYPYTPISHTGTTKQPHAGTHVYTGANLYAQSHPPTHVSRGGSKNARLPACTNAGTRVGVHKRSYNRPYKCTHKRMYEHTHKRTRARTNKRVKWQTHARINICSYKTHAHTFTCAQVQSLAHDLFYLLDRLLIDLPGCQIFLSLDFTLICYLILLLLSLLLATLLVCTLWSLQFYLHLFILTGSYVRLRTLARFHARTLTFAQSPALTIAGLYAGTCPCCCAHRYARRLTRRFPHVFACTHARLQTLFSKFSLRTKSMRCKRWTSSFSSKPLWISHRFHIFLALTVLTFSVSSTRGEDY